jgi:hypothetical protein
MLECGGMDFVGGGALHGVRGAVAFMGAYSLGLPHWTLGNLNYLGLLKVDKDVENDMDDHHQGGSRIVSSTAEITTTLPYGHRRYQAYYWHQRSPCRPNGSVQ